MLVAGFLAGRQRNALGVQANGEPLRRPVSDRIGFKRRAFL